MTLEFLSPAKARAADGFEPVARSAVEPALREAGARLEVRDGWSVAADFGSVDEEVRACREVAGIAESSYLGKLELQGPADALAPVAPAGLEPGGSLRSGGARWCPIHPERLLVLCPAPATEALRERLERDIADRARASLVELTTGLAAVTVIGPASREILARLSALDTRPASFPEHGFAPVSVARVPAMVLREGGDRFLVLFGSAYADYMWTALTDAGRELGASLVGADALERCAEAGYA
jgi:heterotetrameric sarcosine oxidase gamma subunit